MRYFVENVCHITLICYAYRCLVNNHEKAMMNS